MSLNYKLVATQLGESIKYESTINEINRIFLSLTNLRFEEYLNPAITSIRSQTVYSWVLTISNSSLNENKKITLIKEAIELLVINEGAKLKLLSLLPRRMTIRNKKHLTVKTGSKDYIAKGRLQDLKAVKNNRFDFSKLIKLCQELDLAFSNRSYLSVAMLTRAILDHVPPVFGCKNFSEVANNYSSKSFKDSMLNLNNSSKRISDLHVNTQLRKR